jgi:polysaccharide chain length determinant protein (PEP-CTERM system associated)
MNPVSSFPNNGNEMPLSISRRPLDVEDYIDILRRHRAWIIGPLFVGLVSGVVTAFLWPNSYISTGTIRIVPPQVSQRLMQSNISEEMTQRIAAIYQNLSQRENMKALIQNYNLYPDERKRLPLEDVLEKMRNDINLGQVQSLASRGSNSRINVFSVTYSYSDRRLVQRVCQDLVSRFIDESIKARSTQSVMTTEFFKDQFELARRELEDIDNKIMALRIRNGGQLPDQEGMMMSRITSIEAGLQSTSMQISRANQDKLQLQTQLRLLRDQANSIQQTTLVELPAQTAIKNQRLLEAESEIRKYEALLASLRETYKEAHPDVQRVIGYLRAKQRERDRLQEETEAANAALPTAPQRKVVTNPEAVRALRELNSQIATIQTAMQNKDVEIEDLHRNLKDLQGRLKAVQAKAETAPAVAVEYSQLVSGREQVKRRYDDLASKMQMSSMATDLESRKQGETLEQLEAPSIPEEPYAPKRPLIIMIGIVAGFGAGVAMAAGRELRDTSLKNLKDVRAYTKLTVLGSIPFLENDFVVRRRRRLNWLAWAATLVIGVLLMAGVIAYYYTTNT